MELTADQINALINKLDRGEFVLYNDTQVRVCLESTLAMVKSLLSITDPDCSCNECKHILKIVSAWLTDIGAKEAYYGTTTASADSPPGAP